MLNTPLRADGRRILDRNGEVLAVAENAQTATQIVQMVNAAAMM